MSESSILLPGDDITALINRCFERAQTSANITAAKSGPKSGRKGGAEEVVCQLMIGPGLKREPNNRFVAVKCGQLVNREDNRFWVDNHSKRYVSTKGDRVIGFVVSKQAYQCKVDIGTNEAAVLSLLAFPQATKRNKPAIEVGDAVYAQIVTDCPDIEAELVCVGSNNKSGGLGVLSSAGYVLTVPTNIVRRLLAPDSRLIQTLGQKYKFEITCGLNGRVWIHAKNLDTTLTITNFIERLEHIPKCQYQHSCEQLVQGFQHVGPHS